MRFIDFFSGVGGFRIGMEQAWNVCVGHCEKDTHSHFSYLAMHLMIEKEKEDCKSKCDILNCKINIK